MSITLTLNEYKYMFPIASSTVSVSNINKLFCGCYLE